MGLVVGSRKLVQWLSIVLADGIDLSDSSYEVNKSDDGLDIRASGCSQNDGHLTALEVFIPQKANQGDPRPLAIVQGRPFRERSHCL
jgi:hypothetical protein